MLYTESLKNWSPPHTLIFRNRDKKFSREIRIEVRPVITKIPDKPFHLFYSYVIMMHQAGGRTKIVNSFLKNMDFFFWKVSPFASDSGLPKEGKRNTLSPGTE